jgi:hypothetical protein
VVNKCVARCIATVVVQDDVMSYQAFSNFYFLRLRESEIQFLPQKRFLFMIVLETEYQEMFREFTCACYLCTYLLNYLLTPWSRVLEKLTGLS